MEQDKEKAILKEPDISYGGYTYADYLTWDMEEMVELIKGKIFKKAAAAPKRIHQKAAASLGNKFYNFLEGNICEVYFAPFDVRLPVKSKKDDKVNTVVQPDICIVCDPEKLDERGCIGAPDLVMEIMSPGNKQLELQYKYEVYEESGVKEYWLLDPDAVTLLIYSLVNGNYQPSKLMTTGDIVKSMVIKGFELDLEEFFGNLS